VSMSKESVNPRGKISFKVGEESRKNFMDVAQSMYPVMFLRTYGNKYKDIDVQTMSVCNMIGKLEENIHYVIWNALVDGKPISRGVINGLWKAKNDLEDALTKYVKR